MKGNILSLVEIDSAVSVAVTAHIKYNWKHSIFIWANPFFSTSEHSGLKYYIVDIAWGILNNVFLDNMMNCWR